MPPRCLCIGVITFWMATTGWLVWSELRDQFDTDETPPFVIDLVDEAQPSQLQIRWLIWKGEKPPDNQEKGAVQAISWLDHREQDDTFALNVQYNPLYDPTLHPGGHLEFGLLTLNRMSSTYRVDRAGHLLATDADFLFDMPLAKNLSVRLAGAVRDAQFQGKIEMGQDGSFTQEYALNPVPVSHRGSVLLPMHPVNKIRNLHLGQSWKMPLVNPLADALSIFGGHTSGTPMLRVHVLPNLELLPPVPDTLMGPVGNWPCFVIEYDGDMEGKPRTWVRAADGLVLRQDSDFCGTHLAMQRINIPKVINEP